jgi:release factor glutamine methyltransferase
MSGGMPPIRSIVSQASARLAAAGVDAARANAEQLLAHSLGVPRSALLLLDDVPDAARQAFEALVARRATREPLQYLVGSAAFRHLSLEVGPGVFIPRPETELLIDAVLPGLRGLTEPVAVDLGAGSGALALAIAQESPGTRVIAVERSPAALSWLRRNCVGSTVEVVAADLADRRLLSELDGRVDVVVSNPPYVPSAAPVGPEVRHDPAEAVFAGPDGLAVMPELIRTAARLLRPGGVLAIEHDDSQGHSLPRLIGADGRWADILDRVDLSGRPRFATARRSGRMGP